MKRIFKSSENITVISNKAIKDGRLSFSQLGLLVRLLAFDGKELYEALGGFNGHVDNDILALERLGYIKTVNGDYFITDEPDSKL